MTVLVEPKGDNTMINNENGIMLSFEEFIESGLASGLSKEDFTSLILKALGGMNNTAVTGSGYGEEIPEGVEADESAKHFTCTCCGRRFYGMGNDPLPLTDETWDVDDGPRACGDCDEKYVKPARRSLIKMGFDYRNNRLKPYQRKKLKKAVMHGQEISWEMLR